MENELKIKELKKELLDLEERELFDESKKSAESTTSGFILVAIGAICITYGIGYDITINTIVGVAVLLFGIFKMSRGKRSMSVYELNKKNKEEKIILIKKRLLDLEG
ncbi:hypothetical protein N180_01265 [Pedobacter antarcticus 4BY]|uniref:Uncharacterized protein n=2 Tax=Pedobacter antarcticus TaxID=34086 RepID=A0A081PC69_9SPHI|nr:hypothetical protein [Pedobacter antarcticus]KEQ28292.1 hypothetical protein N180_01265 [Pedobacter antarcticus 4BY]SFE47925.1 hypothetical protein SAMN03003324_00619 [Pedobacter antarcticus]